MGITKVLTINQIWQKIYNDIKEALNVIAETTPKVEAMQTDEATPLITYIGWAAPGTAIGAASWKIQRITETAGDFSFEWADGDENYDQTWTGRAGHSYS